MMQQCIIVFGHDSLGMILKSDRESIPGMIAFRRPIAGKHNVIPTAKAVLFVALLSPQVKANRITVHRKTRGTINLGSTGV